ncbi:MAG: AAA family ATPase [Bacteroidaceae bacterium]|nr:AAA family ATPase [Bacteroidaceae bacterium]
MGTYINIGNAGFQRIRRSEYIDKSGLIAVVNSTLFTEQSLSCVTRCRRFGKSMAAKMLCAYYTPATRAVCSLTLQLQTPRRLRNTSTNTR